MSSRPRLLFVDDEPRVLEGISNLLFERSEDWELAFAEGGEQAIGRVEAGERFDVVITDMRMPGHDGIDVLRYVATHLPEAMRIVLSGHSELQRAMEAITLAHQFLSKPCEEEVLISTIERTLRIQRVIRDDELRRLAGTLDSSPPCDATIARVYPLTTSKTATISQVARAVAEDIGLTSKLLQVAGSCIYGHTQVASLAAAIQRIGLEGVGALVLAVQLYGRFPVADRGLFDEVNAHAMKVAQIASAVCTRSEESELAFLCGLLHGIGSAALATHTPVRMRKCGAEVAAGGARIACERREFSIDHAELGAEILDLWQIPSVAAVIRHHHTPSATVHEGGGISAIAALHLADAAALGGERELDPVFMEMLGPTAEAGWMRAKNLARDLT